MASAWVLEGQTRWEAAAAVALGGAGAVGLVGGIVAFSPGIAVVGLLGLVAGAMIILVSPTSALILMALVIPMERLGRFGDDLKLETFSLMRLVGLLALVSVLLHMVLRRQQLAISTPIVLCAILQAQAFASIFYALDPVATQAHSLTMLGALLMLFTVAQGVRDWRTIDQLILAWLFAIIAVGLFQVYDWHSGVAIDDQTIGDVAQRFSTTITQLSERETLGAARRAIGTSSNPGVFGINLLLATPFMFYRLHLARRTATKLFWWAAILLTFYNLLLTNTRAVLILLIILCVLIALTRLYAVTVARGAVIAAAVVAGLPFLPQSIWDRILNFEAYELANATNLSWRFQLWEAALRLGAENWISGIGVGNRTALIAGLDPTRFEATWIMAHNEFLQIFTELGIPGLAVFIAFLGSLIWKSATLLHRFSRNGWHDRHYLFAAAAFCSLVIAPMFAVQVDAFHFPLKGWWLVAGLVIVADRLARSGTNGHNSEYAHVR